MKFIDRIFRKRLPTDRMTDHKGGLYENENSVTDASHNSTSADHAKKNKPDERFLHTQFPRTTFLFFKD